MAKSTRGRVNAPSDGTSGLGMVVRFTPKARSEGVQQLEKGGFRVASSKDFRSAAAVPNDFDGADVQYFERFGIAIVRRDGEKLKPMLQNAMQQKVISAARPERSYRALGGPLTKRLDLAQGTVGGVATPLDRDYLLGYRDAVNELVDRLLGKKGAEGLVAQAAFDETSNTWGLQAARAIEGELSGAGIKVAVLDTGFDETHQDFVGRSVTKKLFATRSSEGDVHGHGTHCIGTACGPLRPTSGPRYGIAYEAEIYAGKVLGDDGFGTDRSIIAGMEWALDEGCHVISMSLGAATQVGDAPSDDYEQIGQVCLDAGTLVIAAAGNESSRPQQIEPVGSPANASTILGVGAVDRSFAPASFSCGGLNPGQEVDIAAPGVDIFSSLPDDKYDRWNGTSMATPHVAGVAALIAQSDPKFRGWALWARLIQLTKPLSSPARDVGKGLLQARGSGEV
ncbi:MULTISPECIES: S8 family serine peptidase [Rhizobium]|uniref:S8 family serine peptidase n=1 Tax=Rhizobium changzhiense TaxID=2692317 RepID=A0A7Z0UDA9_9HYPH|nr:MULTISPECIES: S8 family serine peptidase [Rhizobium]MCV9943173.1 S8 family serine peptidase [Rhizobium sp. BT-175]MCW0014837.1 S8 family serine peptidase [Rhizobium sp. BT-226]NZD63091.1 S8 family serine peptidase [Rhizobium changzhiense]